MIQCCLSYIICTHMTTHVPSTSAAAIAAAAEVQRRAAPVILSSSDTVIASETGSGKTAAFLVPALAQLDYPPDLFPEDLEGPQLLLLVPSFELGVQVSAIPCLSMRV